MHALLSFARMNIDWQLILKIVTGIIIVPVSLLANVLWPWWEKASLPVKILSGLFVLPIVGFAYLTSAWWNSL